MKRNRQDTLRVGIYSGAFDPVHVGHIAFALQAIRAARLDQVVFLPERVPRRKQGVEHYAHRVAMLRRAIAPYPNMSVLELSDKQFSVQRTLPQLQTLFGTKLVMLIGSDVLIHLPNWPHVAALLRSSELAIGVRADDAFEQICATIQTWPEQPQALHVFESYLPKVSSTSIREGLAQGMSTEGLLASVRRYVRAEWLYVSITHAYDQHRGSPRR